MAQKVDAKCDSARVHGPDPFACALLARRPLCLRVTPFARIFALMVMNLAQNSTVTPSVTPRVWKSGTETYCCEASERLSAPSTPSSVGARSRVRARVARKVRRVFPGEKMCASFRWVQTCRPGMAKPYGPTRTRMKICVAPGKGPSWTTSTPPVPGTGAPATGVHVTRSVENSKV